MTVEVKFNHLDRYPGQIDAALDSLINEAANAIAADIKARDPHDFPVTAARSGREVAVRIGSTRQFYAGFVEFGTVDQPAQPFVTPAAESQRHPFETEARNLERRLT